MNEEDLIKLSAQLKELAQSIDEITGKRSEPRKPTEREIKKAYYRNYLNKIGSKPKK